MWSLHKVVETFRTIIRWGIILGGTGLGVYLLINVIGIIAAIINPPKPTPPTVEFGKLPHIVFPLKASDQQFTYTLNTSTGKLPEFPDKMAVYPIIQPSPNLLALKRAQNRAKAASFTSQANQLGPTKYQWSDSDAPYRDIVMDILTNNFELSSRFLSDENVLSAKQLPNEKGAIKAAGNFLNRMQIFPSDIDNTKTKTTLLQIRDQELIAAEGLSAAQIIRVDFYQKDIGKDKDTAIRIVYPYPPFSAMSLFIGSIGGGGGVIRANFFHQNIDLEKSASYPILTPDQAYEILKSGSAYIAAYYGTRSDIVIKFVYLAYYLQDAKQDYLMPVVVFEGNDGFFAYVPVITDKWIQSGTANSEAEYQ